jgi:hypothetical protein
MGKIEFSYYGTGESTALQNRTGAESVHGVAISKPRGGIESVCAANRVVPKWHYIDGVIIFRPGG